MGKWKSRTARIRNELGVKMKLIISDEYKDVIYETDIDTGEYKDVPYSLLNNDHNQEILITISFALYENEIYAQNSGDLRKSDIRDCKYIIFRKSDNSADIEIRRIGGFIVGRLGFYWMVSDWVGQFICGGNEEYAVSGEEISGEIPLMEARASTSHDVNIADNLV